MVHRGWERFGIFEARSVLGLAMCDEWSLGRRGLVWRGLLEHEVLEHEVLGHEW